MRLEERESEKSGGGAGVDTHAHLNLSPLKKDIPGAVARAERAGVARIGNVFLSPEQYAQDRPAFDELPQVFFVLGIHPHEAGSFGPEAVAELEDALKADSRIKAVGEIGLDFYWDKSSRDSQRERFRQQLELARDLDRPVVIHSRDAEEDTMEILRETGFEHRPLLWHCFGLDADFASRVLACGWTVSVPGMLTFKKAHTLRQAVATIPLDRLVLETDCPFLAPEPYRGKTNEPSLIPLIADEVARLHDLDREAVLGATAETAHRFFGLAESQKAENNASADRR